MVKVAGVNFTSKLSRSEYGYQWNTNSSIIHYGFERQYFETKKIWRCQNLGCQNLHPDTSIEGGNHSGLGPIWTTKGWWWWYNECRRATKKSFNWLNNWSIALSCGFGPAFLYCLGCSFGYDGRYHGSNEFWGRVYATKVTKNWSLSELALLQNELVVAMESLNGKTLW